MSLLAFRLRLALVAVCLGLCGCSASGPALRRAPEGAALDNVLIWGEHDLTSERERMRLERPTAGPEDKPQES